MRKKHEYKFVISKYYVHTILWSQVVNRSLLLELWLIMIQLIFFFFKMVFHYISWGLIISKVMHGYFSWYKRDTVCIFFYIIIIYAALWALLQAKTVHFPYLLRLSKQYKIKMLIEILGHGWFSSIFSENTVNQSGLKICLANIYIC